MIERFLLWIRFDTWDYSLQLTLGAILSLLFALILLAGLACLGYGTTHLLGWQAGSCPVLRIPLVGVASAFAIAIVSFFLYCTYTLVKFLFKLTRFIWRQLHAR